VQSPPEYILDRRYETILCAAAINNGPQCIIDGPDFKDWLWHYDPAEVLTVTFNSLFDNSILAWRYGYVPALMCDTMNLARALKGHELRDLKLATVGKYLLGREKGKAIHKVAGMRRADIMADQGLWREFCEYAREDNEQNRGIFKLLYSQLPAAERQIMDMVLRAAVQPQFVLDKDLLTSHLHDLRTAKAKLVVDMLPEAERTEAMVAHLAKNPEAMKETVKTSGIMSPIRFKEALEGLGVQVQYKTSPATGRDTPAFAKTDAFMAKLQEHPDFRVQALAAARLGCKSTLEETRCLRLLKIASLDWPAIPGYPTGALMPIALRYGGAHTHRLSGDWGLNMQNLPRKSVLRQCLLAPSGSAVVVADLAQIEARLVAWIVGQLDLLATFSRPGQKGDPYSAFATEIFGYPVDRKKKEIAEDGSVYFPFEVQGFIGKVGVLGLGYGCGDAKFFLMVETSARLFCVPIDGSKGVHFTSEFAARVVRTYREKYSKISGGWRTLDRHIEFVWAGNFTASFGPVSISRGCIEGPGGLKMQYAHPRWERRQLRDGTWKEGYWFDYGRFTHIIYGSMMLENIIQFLARIILMNTALRLRDQGYRFCQQAHDELGFIVPLDKVDEAKKLIYREFTTPPTWAPDLPLDAEVGSGPTYGSAK
jgi:DNA polymerase